MKAEIKAEELNKRAEELHTEIIAKKNIKLFKKLRNESIKKNMDNNLEHDNIPC